MSRQTLRLYVDVIMKQPPKTHTRTRTLQPRSNASIVTRTRARANFRCAYADSLASAIVAGGGGTCAVRACVCDLCSCVCRIQSARWCRCSATAAVARRSTLATLVTQCHQGSRLSEQLPAHIIPASARTRLHETTALRVRSFMFMLRSKDVRCSPGPGPGWRLQPCVLRLRARVARRLLVRRSERAHSCGSI